MKSGRSTTKSKFAFLAPQPKLEEGKIEHTFMCAKCNNQGDLSIYDSSCQACQAPNPYYEELTHPPSKEHWFCSLKECHTLNVLPSVKCRRCGKREKKAKALQTLLNQELLLKQENKNPELKDDEEIAFKVRAHPSFWQCFYCSKFNDRVVDF